MLREGDHGYPRYLKPRKRRCAEREEAGRSGHCLQARRLGEERPGYSTGEGDGCLAGEEYGTDPSELRVGNQPLQGWSRSSGAAGPNNPTITALSRLAEALGMRLAVTLLPEEGQQARAPVSTEVPASLVRFGRSARFREAVRAIAGTLDLETDELSARLVAALAMLADAMSKDLSEGDWSRILDALLLVAAHPADS